MLHSPNIFKKGKWWIICIFSTYKVSNTFCQFTSDNINSCCCQVCVRWSTWIFSTVWISNLKINWEWKCKAFEHILGKHPYIIIIYTRDIFSPDISEVCLLFLYFQYFPNWPQKFPPAEMCNLLSERYRTCIRLVCFSTNSCSPHSCGTKVGSEVFLGSFSPHRLSWACCSSPHELPFQLLSLHGQLGKTNCWWISINLYKLPSCSFCSI